MAELSRPPIRVLVVDDDPLVRAGLGLLLAGDDLEVVGEAADGAEAIRQVEAMEPDIVLMDLRMPNVDGLNATEQIRQLDDPPEVIVLTTFDADENVVRALEAGAAGFLLKDTAPSDIIAAIHHVAAGDAQLSPSVTRRLLATIAAHPPRAVEARRRLATLTDRERDIANAIGEGRTNAEIGRQLHLAVPTVKAHVTAILTKLQVTNRVQVALIVHDAHR